MKDMKILMSLLLVVNSWDEFQTEFAGFEVVGDILAQTEVPAHLEALDTVLVNTENLDTILAQTGATPKKKYFSGTDKE